MDGGKEGGKGVVRVRSRRNEMDEWRWEGGGKVAGGR